MTQMNGGTVTLFLEMKQEFTEHLVDTLTPYINEGLISIYNQAADIAKEEKRPNKTLMIFQKLLEYVPDWPQTRVEEETSRIKHMSGTDEYLDNLVRGVVKSHIILLTYSNNISGVIAQSFYNTLATTTLIHKCYIECAKDFHNNPFLFYHEVPEMEQKRNQVLIVKNIQEIIVRAIRKILPINLILKEFIANTINIVGEPANPLPQPMMGGDPVLPKLDKPNDNKSDKPVDKKLDKYVDKMIKSENIKSDRDKVKALIQLEKAVNKQDPTSHEPEPVHKEEIAGGKPYQSRDKTKYDNSSPKYEKLSKSDKAVININFNSDSSTANSKPKSSGSATSLPDRPHKRGGMSDLTDIDPNGGFIEQYGGPTESAKNRKNKY